MERMKNSATEKRGAQLSYICLNNDWENLHLTRQQTWHKGRTHSPGREWGGKSCCAGAEDLGVFWKPCKEGRETRQETYVVS